MGDAKKIPISEYYKNNADYLLAEASNLLVGKKPEGGFYFIADFSFMLGNAMPEEAKASYSMPKKFIEDDIDICMALMFGYGQNDKEGLGTVPASCFGIDKSKGFVRISFSSHVSYLKKIAEQIAKVRSS
jgi:aspartate/methionine/tyrosine aminotransferase